jgi:non-heme chloroperoxidase
MTSRVIVERPAHRHGVEHEVARRDTAKETTMKASTRTQRPFVETDDGVQLFVQDWGTGEPIVLVHALGTNSDQWQYNVADLVSSGHRCISFDRRGHGRSDQPRDGYVLPRLVDDLRDVLERLDVRGATLVGHSMGGMEAAAYVAKYGGERVSRLVLVCPTLPCLPKSADNPGGVDRSLLDATTDLWRKDYPDWLVAGPTNVELFYRRDTFPISQAIVDWSVGMMRSTSNVQVQLLCGAILAEADLREDMRRIKVPTLVIHGDHDVSVPVGFGRATAKLIPGSRYVEYEGAPHGLFLTHRERLHADIRAWAA